MTDFDQKYENAHIALARFEKGFPEGKWEIFIDTVHGMLAIIDRVQWPSITELNQAGFHQISGKPLFHE